MGHKRDDFINDMTDHVNAASQKRASDKGLEGVRDSILNLISLLKGTYDVREGVKLNSKGEINIKIKLTNDGNGVEISLLDPKPTAAIEYYIQLPNIGLDGATLTPDRVIVHLAGLPQILEPKFNVIS